LIESHPQVQFVGGVLAERRPQWTVQVSSRREVCSAVEMTA